MTVYRPITDLRIWLFQNSDPSITNGCSVRLMTASSYHGIVDENGNLTNAGALLADESPMRQSRIFCTRWNGLDMTSGLGEAIDDVELEGCVIVQL